MTAVKEEQAKKVYIETYGCQMNVSDSEVVASILRDGGYTLASSAEEANVVLLNTCAIRDNAEVRILGRLAHFRHLRKSVNPSLRVGVLGCMASRMKNELLDSSVGANIVVGPDSYRYLPMILEDRSAEVKSIQTTLSAYETYADVDPLRYSANGISAFTSIMRGCNKRCTYCVVPMTRGMERSRDPQSIVREMMRLQEEGYREVTLLGQNVDSYKYLLFNSPSKESETRFADLLRLLASQFPDLRLRFSTSHPQDMTEDVVATMAEFPNICRHIHLPVQSGSNVMLDRMRRRYTAEHYLAQIEMIRRYLPTCSITTDLIAGFCGETEEDHQQTLSLMRQVRYDFAYMFKYSSRPGTYAANRLQDDVTEEEKTRRLNEIIALQNQHSRESNQQDIGKEFEVLVEGTSKKSVADHCGRTSQNKMVVFPRGSSAPKDLVRVEVFDCTSSTLLGRIVS